MKHLERRYGGGQLHFITCSCYWRMPLLGTARARDCFLTILSEVRERYDFALLGYVVMPEHIHLLISEPRVGTAGGRPFWLRIVSYRRSSKRERINNTPLVTD
jgi:REP element-mobilizing transposase RayT